jgi:hypothetical protein
MRAVAVNPQKRISLRFFPQHSDTGFMGADFVKTRDDEYARYWPAFYEDAWAWE